MKLRRTPSLTRLADQPLLRVGDHPGIGQNLNGPSVVRVPDWVPEPEGKFYMYFAHHTGSHIRMAASDALSGPWQVLDPPPLRLSDTGFAQDAVAYRNADGAEVVETAHIASPDVHVLEDAQLFVMLFHGLHEGGAQCTRIAVSDDGRNFRTTGYDEDVAPPYLRLCKVRERYIGITWGAEVFIAESCFGPFQKGPPVLQRPNGKDLIPRHPVLAWRDERLHCFYTLIGDRPERIWHTSLDPDVPFAEWRIEEPTMLLAPEHAWEGAHLPQVASKVGIASVPEHALRDALVFEDHLFYVGGGEQAIGAVRLDWRWR